MHFHPQDMDHGTMSDADFQDWKAQNRSFEAPGLFYEGAIFEITRKSEPELVSGAVVTAGFFSTLGDRPLLGRVLLPADEKVGSSEVVVLSEGLWRRLFNSNPGVIGQTLLMSGQTFTVVGVMPRSFHLPSESDELWTNYRLGPVAKRGGWFSYGIARLKPGVTIEYAQTEVNEIGRRIERANPTLYSNLTLPLVPLREYIAGNVRPALLVMLCSVFLVLLIAVVNISNLLLGRAASRDREIAVRRSLGAGRIRIVSQLLTENALLALTGGVLGLGLAYGAIELLRAWNPANLPRTEDIRLDGTVLAFTCLVSLGTVLPLGLVPAFQSSSIDLNTGWRQGGRTGAPNRTRRRTHSILAVSEIALSVVLLVSAGLLLRSFIQLQKVDTGFYAPPRNILALKLWVTEARPIDSRTRFAIYQRLLERVRTVPGVKAAALSRTVPPEGGSVGWSPFMIEGQAWNPGTHPAFPYLPISDDYFGSLAVPLLKGRFFTPNDKADSKKVTIISDGLARRYFPNEDPIGKRIKLGGPEYPAFPYMDIVGVVGDVKYFGLARESAPAVYVPLSQDVPLYTFLVVRSNVSALSMAEAMHRAIQSLGGDLVSVRMNTMEELLSDSVAEPRFRTTLLGTFAGVALLLAAIGVYGVLAYSVVQRTHEIGVRIALGGQQGDILRLVVGQGLLLTILGLGIGIAISLGLTFALQGLLFQVKPTDPATLVCVVILLGLTALVASYVPARQAAHINPLVTLHHE